MERPLPQVATLTVLSDQAGLAREFVLRPGEYLIGRLPECEIALPHPTVSGRHARLRLTEGQVLIEDLGSTNGTAVNQRAVRGPVPLRSGDIIQVGEVHLQFSDAVSTTRDQPVGPERASEPVTSSWAGQATFAGEERVSWAPPATAAPPDTAAEAQAVLAAIVLRVEALQREVAALAEVAARLEPLLSGAERERTTATTALQRLRTDLAQLADALESEAGQLGVTTVLANLDALVSAPNDLSLLVNVSRDTARYAALVRLVADLPERLRALAR
ncbi:MAG: FHA domain-containing protein [Chloroflexi bacterium]|nr:FHA domain-containing protein [Chloroflexota bacterium]